MFCDTARLRFASAPLKLVGVVFREDPKQMPRKTGHATV